MKKRECAHLEIEWQEYGQFYQKRYKCKFSKLENSVSTKKRLCRQCKLQLEIKFE